VGFHRGRTNISVICTRIRAQEALNEIWAWREPCKSEYDVIVEINPVLRSTYSFN
jgi:hypothetical protein